MLPTVDQPDASGQDLSLVSVCRLLDTALFRPTGWFVLDANNARVPGVRVPSLVAGLRVVGRGAVTSVVGWLRPGVVVVDIDATGVRGHAIAEQVARWCAREGLWYLVRPSGGTDGRMHVFVVTGSREQEFRDAVVALRGSWRVGASLVDVRDRVRPLSAPHRHGGCPRPLGDLPAALRSLDEALGGLDSDSDRGRAPTVTAPRRPADPFAAAIRSRRRRRTPAPLPRAWQQSYLEQGAAPLREDLEDQSASTAEIVCTGHLVRAGHTPESAWALIQASHPAAFPKAKADPRRFVEHLWNVTVERDHAFLDRLGPAAASGDEEDRGQELVDAAVVAAVDAARTALVDHAWSIQDLRARCSVLLVGHALLDRMLRTGSTRVPCPLRDLVLDTGIRTLSTISTVLRRLHSAGVGVLHECFDPAAERGSSSHEFSISSSPEEGVSANHTPSIHTPPLPAAVLTLRPAARLLCRALLASGDQVIPVSSLIHLAQVSPTPDGTPSPAQERSALDALAALAQVGAARCDETGAWCATAADRQGETDSDEAVAAQRHAAIRRHQHLVDAVLADRAAYRARLSSGWVLARDQACRAQRMKERAWWSQLTSVERVHRQQAHSSRFHRLDAVAQAQVKHALVARDHRDGIDPARRHQDWCEGLSAHEYARRQVERTARYQALPHPLQRAYAAAWDAHRGAHGIARGSLAATTAAEHAHLLPDPAAERDAAAFHEAATGQGSTQRSLFETGHGNAV